MKKSYQHIFFDLDHTLWDFENNSRVVLQSLFDQNNLAEKLSLSEVNDFQVCYERNNEKFWDRFRKGFISREDLRWKRMWHTLMEFKVNDMELTHFLSDQYLELLPSQIQLMPNSIEILNYCKEKNYQLHIITNGYELVQWKKLKGSGLDGYFENVITSENSKSMKPKKEIFEFALKQSGATVENSLMIGDAIEADVLGAKSVGMDQVFYNFYRKEHAEKPTYEVSCLSELQSIL